MKQTRKIIVFFLLIIALVSSYQAFAQKKWKNGYFVSQKDDTLKGYIYYKHTQKPPQSFKFKSKADGDVHIYLPIDISMFMTYEESQNFIYKSFITELDYSPTDLDKIDTSSKPKMVRDTIFAQFILKGSKNLYYYKDYKIGKIHYLVENENGKLTELIYKPYYINATKEYYLVHNESYKNQLRELTEDCSSIASNDIYATKFSLESITQLVKTYNAYNNKNKIAEYEFKPEKIYWQFGVLGGINMTTIKISGQDYVDALQFNYTPAFEGGISLNVVAPRSEKSWSVYNELLYTHYQLTSSPTSVNTLWGKVVTGADVNNTYLKLFTTIRYQYPYSKIKPFIEAGMANGFATQIDANLNTVTTFVAPYVYEKTPICSFRYYEQAFCIGLGGTFNRIGVLIRYEGGNGFSSSGGIYSNSSYLHFLLSYTII